MTLVLRFGDRTMKPLHQLSVVGDQVGHAAEQLFASYSLVFPNCRTVSGDASFGSRTIGGG
jgi:hypothetical protein